MSKRRPDTSGRTPTSGKLRKKTGKKVTKAWFGGIKTVDLVHPRVYASTVSLVN